MSTLAFGNRENLFNIMKAKAPNGGVLDMSLTLAESNDMLRDFPVLPSNGGMYHQGVRWTSLPNGQLVQIGGTWGASKGDLQPFTEGMMIMRARYQSPKDVLKIEGINTAAYLAGQNDAFVEGLGQSWANLLIRGDTTPRQESIDGLMQRSPWNAIDKEFCFDAGGAAANKNLRSCWLACPGANTVHLIYNPAHPTIGIEREDKGEVFVPVTIAADGSVTAGRWDIIIEYAMIQGICIRDPKALKRIANVPCGFDDAPTTDLLNAIMMARLKHRITGEQSSWSPTGGKQWYLYCDADLYTKLVIGANEKLKVFMSDKNIYQTALPMIGDIIIRRMDALNYAVDAGETAVA